MITKDLIKIFHRKFVLFLKITKFGWIAGQPHLFFSHFNLSVMKHFLLFFSILMLAFAAQAEHAPAVYRLKPVTVYTQTSYCRYAWMTYDDVSGTVLGSGTYCTPGCTEPVLARTANPAVGFAAPIGEEKVILEAALVKHIRAALPALDIRTVKYNPAMRVVEGVKVQDLSQLPIEIAKSLAATGANQEELPGKPGACLVKECSLFPNPVHDVLTLRFVYDCSSTGGRVVKEATITATSLTTGKQQVLWTGQLRQESNELAVPVAELAAGLYKVRVQVGVFDKSYDMQKL